MNALRSVLAASRPISWVNTAFPYGAAYLVVGGAVDWLFWVGVLFFLVPYNIALYGINDVFDYESDIRNPRKGGVEGAVLAKDKHQLLLWSALLSTAPFLVVLYLAGTWHSALWLTLTMAAVLAYSAPKLRFKERPVLDSVTSAAHFVGPALVGSTIIGADLNMWFWWAMAAFMLWGMASHAFGAVQDVRADREGGLHSIATVLGARATVWLATLAYLAAAIILFLMPGKTWIIGVAALTYVLNTGRFGRITDAECERVNHGWRVFLWLNYLVGAAVTITILDAFLR